MNNEMKRERNKGMYACVLAMNSTHCRLIENQLYLTSAENVILTITITAIPSSTATPKMNKNVRPMINEYVISIIGQWGPTCKTEFMN